jgi:polyphosphate kinase 2 (PPK2 family)
VIFEGRDGAGKGGTIRAITERVSPRVFRVVALPAPSDREKSQILRSNDKMRARLNCIRDLLSLIPYKKLPREKIKLPKRSRRGEYDDEATIRRRHFVPERY